MGCVTTKKQKEERDSMKVRKPNQELINDKFWDDPSIKDNGSREQTIASIENIHYYYKFEKKIGQGSFGFVSLGIPVNDPSKKVAIKTIPKENVQGIPQHYLKREVDIIKRLDHPNICKFLETYMDKENIYVVMEYCEGGTLKELIYSQNNSEFNVAKIMQKLFWAVNYMHNNNIVHRDLKLENVIFTSTNPATSDIKIIDFGLSKKLHDNQKRRHTKVGSFNYMAPEVLLHRQYDKECDIWSLGCMMFALISGELPFYDIKSIQEASFTFQAESWKLVSKDARNLIELMLVISVSKRISLTNAMNHSWFKRLRKNTLGTIALPRQPRGSKQLVIERLLNYKQQSIFKKKVLQILVKQMENAEHMKPKDIFGLIDKSGNGYISVQDLKEVINRFDLQQFKDEQSIEQLVYMISNNAVDEAQLQKAHQKKINYSEFLAATLDSQYFLNMDRLKIMFKYLDASETGHISQEDLIDILAREGRKLPPEDIAAIYNEISPYLNKKKELDFDSFCNIMKQEMKDGQLEQVNEASESNNSSVDSGSSSHNNSQNNNNNKNSDNHNNDVITNCHA